jgi:hypothetical protein
MEKYRSKNRDQLIRKKRDEACTSKLTAVVANLQERIEDLEKQMKNKVDKQ